MRALPLLAGLVFCWPLFVAGQTADQSQPNVVQGAPNEAAITAEAIAAIARGDHTRGAELLKPLVEPWAREFSQLAAFHLAQLYEKGTGVPRNPLLACALYMRAAAPAANLPADRASQIAAGQLAEKALELSFVQSELLGPNGQVECMTAVNIGPDHRFAPASFTLGIDHWVTIELRNSDVMANISYRGQEKSVQLAAPAGLGAIFLPFQYTALETAPGAPPRHFIEAVGWIGGQEGKWGLYWALTEIAEGDAIEVASTELDVFEGSAPPDSTVVNFGEYVTLRVNEFGKAEYAIVKGPSQETAGIPDRKEREEIASELARRDAAKKAIDWKLRRDPARAPSFIVGDDEGCGNVQLFAWSSDRTEAIVAYVDRELFELSASPRTIDLATTLTGVRVFADVRDRPRQSSYCSDFQSEEQGHQEETWQAVGGTLTIQVSPPGSRARNPQQYRATIQIDNAVFRNASGRIVRASAPIRLTGMAGLVSG